MATIPIPTIIQGPAFIGVNGHVQYVQKDITMNGQPESWNPESSFGPLGERHKARKDVISYTPVGMLTAALLDFFYAAHLDATKIGKSVINSGAPTVFISSITENKTYTWSRGGLTKPPGLMLKPTATAFGEAEVTCIGKAATSPLDAAFWKAAEAAATADTSFDETKVISDIYAAALSDHASPYDNMGGMDGFELDFGYGVKEIPNGDVGIADLILESLSTGLKFAPSNMTEAQVDSLLALQGASAILPGQPYARDLNDIDITGTQVGWVFSLKGVGAKSSGRIYQIGEHRFKELLFVNQRTFAAGVPNPLFAYSEPA